MRWSVVAVAVLGSLAAAGIVSAANPGKEKVAFTKAGKAQARAEVLRRTDLGPGWSGGFKKFTVSTFPKCSYRPKQSDLVLIGGAETIWDNAALTIDSTAQVLRTAAMVRLDWKRTVIAPQVQPCLRKAAAKSLGSKGKLVSYRRVAFPHLARYARAFRAVLHLTASNASFQVEIDQVALGAGRNELALTLIGPSVDRARLRRDAVRMARLLVRRFGP